MAFQSETNPLLNQLILDNVFQNLPVSDLKSARLVCRLWRDGSLSQWRKSGVLVLQQTYPIRGRGWRGRKGFRKCLSIRSYWCLIWNHSNNGLKLGEKPFSKVKLTCWEFPEDDEISQEEALLRAQLGASVKYLHLDRCNFWNYALMDDLLTRSFPQLTKLVWTNSKFGNWAYPETIAELRVAQSGRQHFLRNLTILEIPGDNNSHDLLSCWDERMRFARLLSVSPALQEITFHKSDKEEVHKEFVAGRSGRHVKSLLEEISLANSLLEGKLTIRVLDIMDFFRDASYVFVNGVAQDHVINLPHLERLTVDVGALTTHEEATQIFSKLGGEPLQVLKIFRAPLEAPWYESLPLPGPMESLRELHLWGNITPNLEFLQWTPNLQTLLLKTDCYDKWYKLKRMIHQWYGKRTLQRYTKDLVESMVELVRSRGTPSSEEDLLTVTTLEHLELDCDLSTESILTLAKWLPNVKNLHLVLNNDTLKTVCKAWPDLKELECLFGSRIDDDGVSGLLLLKELRSFKLNAYCNEGLLSSASADQVFLKMGTLTDLNICVSSEMSEKSVEELKGRIPKVTVTRNYDRDNGEKHNNTGECCDRNTFLRHSVEGFNPDLVRNYSRVKSEDCVCDYSCIEAAVLNSCAL